MSTGAASRAAWARSTSCCRARCAAPATALPTSSAEHTFETTALATAGNQAGTYYGSVRWGYQTDNAGVHTKLPLEVVSFGVPTANFVEAAKQWNVTPASGGTASLKPPVNFVAPKVEVAYATKPGQNVFLSGSTPELGSWNPAHAFALQYVGPGKWAGDVNLNANQGSKELKYSTW
jgi:hypothetical protein